MRRRFEKWEMRNGTFNLLRKRLAFLVLELKKIAKPSRSLCNHWILEWFADSLDYDFSKSFRSFETMIWGCIYRKMEGEGWCCRNSVTLVDHCQLPYMAGWDSYGNRAIFGICLNLAYATFSHETRTEIEQFLGYVSTLRTPLWRWRTPLWSDICHLEVHRFKSSVFIWHTYPWRMRTPLRKKHTLAWSSLGFRALIWALGLFQTFS